MVKENERVDDLQLKGFKIIQDPAKFCFGIDAVLLSGFADVRKGDTVMDLGTGTGIIPILLAGKTLAQSIYGVDIQPDMIEMAGRSILLNKLESRVFITQMDIKDIGGENTHLKKRSFDVVTSNPPYKKAGSGLINPDDSKAVARHELLCSLGDVICAAAFLLKVGGRLEMVHRPERLADIFYAMRQANIEPKRVQMVYSNYNKPPSLTLVEGVLGGRPSLKWLPPLFIYDSEGNYTKEVRALYGCSRCKAEGLKI